LRRTVIAAISAAPTLRHKSQYKQIINSPEQWREQIDNAPRAVFCAFHLDIPSNFFAKNVDQRLLQTLSEVRIFRKYRAIGAD